MMTSLSLRPFREEDIDAMLTWFPSQPAVTQWGGPDLQYPLARADLLQMFEEAGGPAPTRLFWSGVCDDRMAAHAQMVLDWRQGVGRLARVALNPDFRGQALAAPFLAKILADLFSRPQFERVELNVYTFNTSAIRTYRRIGFREEGVRRSSVRVGDERWDTAIYGLLRGEYEALQQTAADAAGF